MELGLEYCRKHQADLLLATDPDVDRCGIAVRSSSGDYVLLSGNEVGILLLDYICMQRIKHGKMPKHPVFVKTIVTMDLAEKVADHYGVQTINVLTGFKYIGEQISRLPDEHSYICGFEESYGYLTGSYVRDKDAVNAAFIIAEMFAFYKTHDISLLDKLQQIYKEFGYCLNTLHSYEYPGSSGMEKMNEIMRSLRVGLNQFRNITVTNVIDYSQGVDGLPKSDVLKFCYQSEAVSGSVVIRPSGTEPKLKLYISVMAEKEEIAKATESSISHSMKKIIGSSALRVCE